MSTVAEILGIGRPCHYSIDRDDGAIETPWLPDAYTPDDMRAWGVAQGWYLTVLAPGYGGNPVTVKIGAAECDDDLPNVHAPTLHAALEAAVLAIHERTQKP